MSKNNAPRGQCIHCKNSVDVPIESRTLSQRNPQYSYIFQFGCKYCGNLAIIDSNDIKNDDTKEKSNRNEYKKHEHNKGEHKKGKDSDPTRMRSHKN